MEVPCTLKREATVRLVVDAFVAVNAEMNPFVKESPVPEIPVVEALVVVSAAMNPLVKERPVPEMAVEDALPRYA